jgi:hypothetical protein
MNGRTTDKDRPGGYKAKPNVFWVVYAGGSYGNWENPKVTITEHFGGVQKNTSWEFTVDKTYGTRWNTVMTIDLFAKFRDSNYQEILEPGQKVYWLLRVDNYLMPCSVGGPRKTAGPLLKVDRSPWNILDLIAFIELGSEPTGPYDFRWGPCGVPGESK